MKYYHMATINYRKFDKISAKLHFNDMTDFKITACGNLSGAEN